MGLDRRAYPLWSLILIVANVLVIYHLATTTAPDRKVEAFPEPIAAPPDRPPAEAIGRLRRRP